MANQSAKLIAAENTLPDAEHRAAFHAFLADYKEACEVAGMKRPQYNYTTFAYMIEQGWRKRGE
jgi:hypothetical protein